MAEAAGLIFDLDGTLIHSAPQIHAAALEVLASEGLQAIDYAQLVSFVGAGIAVLVARILQAQGLPVDDARHARMCRDFIHIYEQRFDLTMLYPGVAKMLAELARCGHPMAICTNKPEAPTRAILAHFGLTGYFPVIVGGDTLPRRKPDPAPLFLAIERLGAAAVWFVGDSEVDAQTARAAEVRFLLFRGGYRNTDAQRLGAVAIFDDHAALPGLVV